MLDAFFGNGAGIACVQARLTIDNTDDGWLAKLFTAEYAAQFDLFLPGLAALKLPLPLGGTSNHFRTAVLREIGAWDSHNVTEDADLGLRLARFGYRSTMIASSTYEEAPTTVRAWLRQRTRWMKGWMQTWAVHMRNPRRLYHDLGFGGFMTLQLVVGGNVMSALVHPILLCGLLYACVAGVPIFAAGDGVQGALLWLSCTTFAAGYLTSILLGLCGLARRKLWSAAWALAFVWLLWLLLSLAAWRALYQLICKPHVWEKTQHGLARTSRLAKMSRPAPPEAARRVRRREREMPKAAE